MPLAITVIGDSLVFVRTSKSCNVRVKTILGTSSQAHTQQFSTCGTLQHFSVATATKGKLSGSSRLEWESGNNTVQSVIIVTKGVNLSTSDSGIVVNNTDKPVIIPATKPVIQV